MDWEGDFSSCLSACVVVLHERKITGDHEQRKYIKVTKHGKMLGKLYENTYGGIHDGEINKNPWKTRI